MSSSRRSCINNPDTFCYICGTYVIKKFRKPLTAFVKKAYFDYFNIKIKELTVPWLPKIVCKLCVEHLRQWASGKRAHLKYSVPMIWSEPKNHLDDCYFCVVKLHGINRKKMTYPDLTTARRPIPNSNYTMGVQQSDLSDTDMPEVALNEFVKALDKNGACFAYITKKFPGLSAEKLKAGIFDGPQIRTLIKDNNFIDCMNNLESVAWKSFVQVVTKFLGNEKADNYVELVNDLLGSFKNLGCNMSIKVHYLHSHLDKFPENLGSYSEEQGERFHQDLKEMEDRYQGRWDEHMLADYCWSITRECHDNVYSKKSRKRSFIPVKIRK